MLETKNKFAVRNGCKTWLILAAMLFFSTALLAEEPVACKSRGGEIRVVYPDLARRMKITGIVRLELQLNPAGSVRATKVLGGNPLLAAAAQDAVKQAKFESNDSCIVIFEFKQ